MANPILNEKTFAASKQQSFGTAGWAAPAEPISRYQSPMTARGAASAAILLMLLLVTAAIFGWTSVGETTQGRVNLPAWILGAVIGGLVLAIVLRFRPKLSRVLAPVYAIIEGLVVGAISRFFNTLYSGIVLQAVGVTLGVFVVMLVLYRNRIIRVSNKMRRSVIGATMGIGLFYGVALLANLFGANISFLHSSSLLSIGLSLFIAGVAAMNLAIDFDLIEQGEKEALPKYMEWYAAFGLLVTIVWLYLEILRLLAKLRDR